MKNRLVFLCSLRTGCGGQHRDLLLTGTPAAGWQWEMLGAASKRTAEHLSVRGRARHRSTDRIEPRRWKVLRMLLLLLVPLAPLGYFTGRGLGRRLHGVRRR